MRDYDGFNVRRVVSLGHHSVQETQHNLLQLRPAQRMYWIGLTVSYHLLKQYDNAINVLDMYEQTAKVCYDGSLSHRLIQKKDREEGTIDYEHSELMLYKNMIYEESGNLEKALDHLDTVQSQICDKRSWKEKRGWWLMGYSILYSSATFAPTRAL
jgi:peptide alpha-N-acetyltransferase